jgi:hypothetical protein
VTKPTTNQNPAWSTALKPGVIRQSCHMRIAKAMATYEPAKAVAQKSGKTRVLTRVSSHSSSAWPCTIKYRNQKPTADTKNAVATKATVSRNSR